MTVLLIGTLQVEKSSRTGDRNLEAEPKMNARFSVASASPPHDGTTVDR